MELYDLIVQSSPLKSEESLSRRGCKDHGKKMCRHLLEEESRAGRHSYTHKQDVQSNTLSERIRHKGTSDFVIGKRLKG